MNDDARLAMDKPTASPLNQPIDMSPWQGRVDVEVDGIRWHQRVEPLTSAATDGIVLQGFCCDAGVARNHGRPGARGGPAAIRHALANLPWFGGVPVYDGGDVICGDDRNGAALEAAQAEMGARIAALLDAGHYPITLGGGHEVAFASWQGIATHLAKQPTQPRIGIVNFDAHFDLRTPDPAGSSGTPFAQIAADCAERGWDFSYACLGIARTSNTQALFRRADELGVLYCEDRDFERDPAAIGRRLDAFVSHCDHIYQTFDMDCLPAGEAPGVSAPAGYGVPFRQIAPLLERVLASGKVRLADVAEFNPGYDIDQHTQRLVARLVHLYAGQS